jgi:predicted dehydrogenase
MKTIRWGIIGCGDVTEVKSGPGLYKAEHSQLLAVMRRNGALAADYAKRHGVPRWHDDADAIIRAPISTPCTRDRARRIATTCFAARPPASRS